MGRVLDLLELGLRGIWRQKLRASMAMMTIAVAIFSIALIVGNAVAIQEEMTQRMKEVFDPGLLQIRTPTPDEAGGRPSRAHFEMGDLAALKDIPGISRIEPMISLGVMLKSGREALEAEAIAAMPTLLETLPFKISSGRALGPAEDECLLTQESAEALFTGSAIGQAVRVSGRSMRVVGIFDLRRAALRFDCLLPLSAGRTIGHVAYPTTIYIRTVNEAAMPQVRRGVNAFVAMEFGKRFIQTMVRADTDANEASLRSFQRGLALQGVFVTLGLMLAIATVAEMLYADVQTNLAEIGVLRALGARKLDILCQIGLQSVMICLVGGGVGLMLTQSYPFWPGQLRQYFQWSNAPLTAYVGLVTSFAGGIVASLVPAYAAIQVSPTEAMRETNR